MEYVYPYTKLYSLPPSLDTEAVHAPHLLPTLPLPLLG